MAFRHPEILYALFLLLIPVIVHLFQLRRFRKIPFTNVAFLQRVEQQSRRSSRIKKWLTLMMRLLALACIVMAFAQPYKADKNAPDAEKEWVLYLDNSLSMQATGSRGELLESAANQLFETTDLPERMSWFTNTEVFRNANRQSFREEVLKTPFSPTQHSVEAVLLQAENLFSTDRHTGKNLIVISDFQQRETLPDVSEKTYGVHALQLEPAGADNVSIDTAYVSKISPENMQLTAGLTRHGKKNDPVPVSLYEGERLLAKTSAEFGEDGKAVVSFETDTSPDKILEGVIQIPGEELLFDNTLHFTVGRGQKIKTLSINGTDDGFLKKIYTPDAFKYTAYDHDQLDYSVIPEQNLIVLNELDDIPANLQAALVSFVENGGSLTVIPTAEADIDSYNRLMQAFGPGAFLDPTAGESREVPITRIGFSHPLYEGVFEREITNFQYPKVSTYYPMETAGTPALAFEDGSPFLYQNGPIWVFSASLNPENSNFQNAPLIVPTFYSMAQKSLSLPQLYFEVGRENHFDVGITLPKDRVLHLEKSGFHFIPQQQGRANKVTVTTVDEPAEAGIYDLVSEGETVQKVAYNHPRSQSVPSYVDAADWPGATIHNSFGSLFDSVAKSGTTTEYWKLLVIFALLFLLFEMLVLKLIK